MKKPFMLVLYSIFKKKEVKYQPDLQLFFFQNWSSKHKLYIGFELKEIKWKPNDSKTFIYYLFYLSLFMDTLFWLPFVTWSVIWLYCYCCIAGSCPDLGCQEECDINRTLLEVLILIEPHQHCHKSSSDIHPLSHPAFTYDNKYSGRFNIIPFLKVSWKESCQPRVKLYTFI